MLLLLLKCLSHVWLFVAPWTVAHQAFLSMEFSRQEYWNGFPFPPPEINAFMVLFFFFSLPLGVLLCWLFGDLDQLQAGILHFYGTRESWSHLKNILKKISHLIVSDWLESLSLNKSLCLISWQVLLGLRQSAPHCWSWQWSKSCPNIRITRMYVQITLYCLCGRYPAQIGWECRKSSTMIWKISVQIKYISSYSKDEFSHMQNWCKQTNQVYG